jgi:hypothetical protein
VPASRVDEFRTAAAAKDIPAAEVDRWLEHARFYLCLPVVPEGARPVDGPVAGRKGGLPLLPPDMPWPAGPSGRPLPFHGLVDCAALPRDERLDLHLPAGGYFLFFADFDETMFNGAEFEHEQEACRLIHVPGGVPVAERPQPAFAPFPVVELRAVIDVDTPGWLEDEDRDDFPEFAAAVPRWHELGRLAEDVWGGWFGDRDIRLGGFPYAPQDEPTHVLAEIEHRATGGDLRELESRAEREWVPLAQLGSEQPDETATVARFLARRADVAAGDFTRVVSLAEFME